MTDKPQTLITVSRELLEFLGDEPSISKTIKPYSKYQAFCWLCDMQFKRMLNPDAPYHSPTTRELAAIWGWSKTTVHRFIKSLVELDGISLTPVDNRKIISLKHVKLIKKKPS